MPVLRRHAYLDSLNRPGYLSKQYASSFEEFGEPLLLPRSGGWILVRKIPGTMSHDAMGLYPLLFCTEWEALQADLQQVSGEIVSFSAVTDPLADPPLEDWRSWAHIVRPYKTHYVADLSQPLESFVSKSNLRGARRALESLRVEINPWDASANLDSWSRLYRELVRRHDIKGLQKFSRNAFRHQLSVPGIVYVQALLDGCPVGANIVYLQDQVSYGHLSAFSQAGYESRAPAAIKWTLLRYLSTRVKVHSLGGGAGVKTSNNDGLVAYKKSWTNSTRVAHFLGVVTNPEAYADLLRTRTTGSGDATSFFPAYRAD